ncbi:MAG TPA: N-acetylmuramoyl-L-alanine amidase [Vicinamibacterales bacterium]|nr:N-acetylmuramoyl-L-alanine amidase [Vicinamibacterales bacterium]
MLRRPLIVSPALAGAVIALWLLPFDGAPRGAFDPQPSPSQPPPTYTLLSRDGRRTLAVRLIDNRELVALDDLAPLFNLSVREDTAIGALVVTAGARGPSIVLSLTQGLASVGGRLVSLPGPPVRDGRSWLVPIEFLSRALAPVSPVPLDVRRRSRLIVLGDLHVPRVAARHEALGSAARVTLDIAPPTPHAVTQEDRRLVIRFEADALDAELPGPTGGDIVTAVRAGETPSAIAIDLGPRFGSFRAADQPPERGTARLVVDVLAPAETPPPPPEGVPPLLEPVPQAGIRTVVIDPGHGGEEPGVRGPAGTLEKQVTLAVARRLKTALEARLGLRALLTREGDQTMSLDERAAVANNNKADLFLSLHANASMRPAAAGAEVFSLSLEDYGPEARQAAAGAGERLPVFGGGTRAIEIIPWELAQARHAETSALFAAIVADELRARVPMSPRPLQRAPLRVLVGANMPAVLVELGFLTNPDQERALAGEAFQQQVVQALVAAVARAPQPEGTR